MSGFTITITDAGRAALINAQNNGTTAFVLSQIGVAIQAIATPLAALTTLPNETKRLATMAGDVVADDTLHVTIRDETTDAYALRAFGIYTDTGVLFAVYSQADPIIEKSAAAMLLLAVDARLLTLDTDQVEFGPVGFTLPPATETLAGISEVATDAEADAGTDNWRYITPRLLKRALSALSGFAAIGHKHDAGDVETGTFHVSRIPELAMSKITGLVAALGAKADAVHSHGVAAIAGLSDALAGKAASVHQHAAEDIVSGVLTVARIPSLAMDKITGLVAALASKAPINSPDFTGSARLPYGTVVKADLGGEGGELHLERPPISDLAGNVAIDVFTNNVRIYEIAGGLRGFSLDLRQCLPGIGSRLWHSENFNPNLKANANEWTNPDGSVAINGYKQFNTQGAQPMATGVLGRAAVEVRAATTGAAYMCFHRPDQFATFFGVDTDNQLKFGGWSAGEVAHLIYHSGNYSPSNAAQYRANVGSNPVSPATVWSAAEIQTITQGATLMVNFGTGLNFTTVMTGNRTLGAPANAKPGQSGVIQIWQDGTGGRTLTFDPAWKFANGLIPQLSTAANARDVLVFTVIAPGDVVASLMKDVRR